MKKGLIIVAALAALALPMGTTAHAQQQQNNKHAQKAPVTTVKGTVSKVEGDTITVENKEIKVGDKTVITVDGKPAPADRKVEVGDKITAKITDGVATKIEIRTATKPHQKDGANANQPKAEGQPNTDQPKAETPK